MDRKSGNRKSGRRLKEKLYYDQAEQLFLIIECFRKIDKKISFNTTAELFEKLDYFSSKKKYESIAAKIFNPGTDENEKYGLVYTDTFYSFLKAIKAGVPYHWEQEALILFLNYIKRPEFIEYAKKTNSEFELSPLVEQLSGKRYSVYLIDRQKLSTEPSVQKYIIHFTSVVTVDLIQYDYETGQDVIIPGSFEIAGDGDHVVLNFYGADNKRWLLVFQISTQDKRGDWPTSDIWFGRFFDLAALNMNHLLLGIDWNRSSQPDIKLGDIGIDYLRRNVLITDKDTEKPACLLNNVDYSKIGSAYISADAMKILRNKAIVEERDLSRSRKIFTKKYGFAYSICSYSLIVPGNDKNIVALPYVLGIRIPSTFRPIIKSISSILNPEWSL